MKTLLVADGHNLLHRAYYATPQLNNADGLPTNAIKGFVNILLADMRRADATHVAVVFDRPGLNFRHKLYPEYKANREHGPHADLGPVLPVTRSLLREMGIRVYGKRGIEGDDLIGSLAVRAADMGHRVVISSNDKDFAALVDDQIVLLKPKGLMLDHDGVVEAYGVTPDQMIDYLMMLGDAVDNIPGVNKVGPKTAAKLLKQHGSLRSICREAKLTPKMTANFKAAKPFFKLSRKLITLRTDYLEDFKMSHVRLRGPQPGLERMCQQLDFRSTYKTILSALG